MGKNYFRVWGQPFYKVPRSETLIFFFDEVLLNNNYCVVILSLNVVGMAGKISFKNILAAICGG